jgi:hypothetical protein
MSVGVIALGYRREFFALNLFSQTDKTEMEKVKKRLREVANLGLKVFTTEIVSKVRCVFEDCKESWERARVLIAEKPHFMMMGAWRCSSEESNLWCGHSMSFDMRCKSCRTAVTCLFSGHAKTGS